MTIEEVRADLAEIKYYYSRQKDIDIACETLGKSAIITKVERYTAAVQQATAELLDIYVGLYVQGNTQDALAYDMGYSVGYVRTRNLKLVQYFQSVL